MCESVHLCMAGESPSAWAVVDGAQREKEGNYGSEDYAHGCVWGHRLVNTLRLNLPFVYVFAASR